MYIDDTDARPMRIDVGDTPNVYQCADAWPMSTRCLSIIPTMTMHGDDDDDINARIGKGDTCVAHAVSPTLCRHALRHTMLCARTASPPPAALTITKP